MSTARAERLVNLVLALLSTRQFLTAERIRGIVPGYADAVSDEDVVDRGLAALPDDERTVAQLAVAQAEELRPHGVAAVALTPGFLRSEAVLDHFGVTEETWRDALEREAHFAISESLRS